LRKPIPNVDFRPAGQENMRHWLAEDWRDLRCTALLAQNDETAIGAMEALREAKYSIPDDISIIGYDGTEICEYSHPQLTSVEVPLTLIAKTGVEVLLAHIAGRTETPRHIVLPTLLRVRASVKPRIRL
jgi:LacI family transcriptional regulator